MRTKMHKTLLLLAGILVLAPAWADCKSDCKNHYDAELDRCHKAYDNPFDLDQLRLCLQDAKMAFEQCLHDCEL